MMEIEVWMFHVYFPVKDWYCKKNSFNNSQSHHNKVKYDNMFHRTLELSKIDQTHKQHLISHTQM